MTQRYEYRVVPAPRRGEKARGVKTTEDRFAYALTTLMNEMAGAGWDYQRAESLPVDERAGLTGTKTTFQNMLVFRRSLSGSAVAGEPVLRAAESATPIAVAPVVSPAVAPSVAPVSVAAAAEADPAPQPALKPLRLGAAITPEGSSPALGPAQSAEPTK